MNSLTAGIIDEIQSGTESHHILIQGMIARDVYADKFRVGQVPNNLINNAINYSPEADKLLVELSQDKDKTYGVVTVKDFGIGIPEEGQENLFQPSAVHGMPKIKRLRV